MQRPLASRTTCPSVIARSLVVVGHVEEVAVVLPETELSSLLNDRLAQHNDTVGPVRPVRSVFELGEILSGQTQVEVTALADDLLLDPRRFGALLSLIFERLICPSHELAVRVV